MDSREACRRDRFEQLATAIADEANATLGLKDTDANAGHIRMVVIICYGGLRSIADAVLTNDKEGQDGAIPFLIPN